MEKIIKKILVPKYIQVQSDEFKEEVIYKTFDGKEFISYDDAFEHEDELKYGDEIPYYDNGDIVSTGDTWYKARDKDELEYLIRRLSKNKYNKYSPRGEKKINPGEWFSVVYDYDPNGPDTVTFVPLNELKEDVRDLLKNLHETL